MIRGAYVTTYCASILIWIVMYLLMLWLQGYISLSSLTLILYFYSTIIFSVTLQSERFFMNAYITLWEI